MQSDSAAVHTTALNLRHALTSDFKLFIPISTNNAKKLNYQYIWLKGFLNNVNF